jgi:hypothetical protein
MIKSRNPRHFLNLQSPAGISRQDTEAEAYGNPIYEETFLTCLSVSHEEGVCFMSPAINVFTEMNNSITVFWDVMSCNFSYRAMCHHWSRDSVVGIATGCGLEFESR